ncbi:hypothetical protein ACEPAG_8941 [Sanghuangporus baumii]
MSSSGHSANTTISTSTSSSASSALSMDDYCVYPAPPPTVNRLSSRQKAQLRRSTTKLTRLLGEAPQVVDEMPSRIGRTAKMDVSVPRKLQPSLSIMSHAPCATRAARSASLRRKVDPELYPLSSTLRPASCDVVRSRTRGAAVSRTSSESKKSMSSRRRSRSMSSEFLMNENVNASVTEDDEKSYSSFVVVSRSARFERHHHPRPDSMASRKSRDSLCDSVLDFEPSFRIPSATKMKREKMARVCKLLGEDVPVHLVFPVSQPDDPAEDFSSSSPSSSSSSSSDSDLDSELVLDISAPPPPPTPLKEVQSQIQNQTQIETQTRIVSPPQPPPLPPKNNIKRKPVPKADFDEKDLKNADLEAPLPPLPTKAELKQEEEEEEAQETRWQPTLAPTPPSTSSLPMTYRASRLNLDLRLETIIEQSPRTSYSSSSASSMDRRSSRSSTSSNYSLLSTTTSSSYRFTSSGCLSSSSSPSDCSAPTSSSGAHAHAYEAPESPCAQSNTANVQQQIHEMSSSSGTHGRREFAIYVPFRRRPSALANSCQTQFVNANSPNQSMSTIHEHELVRGMLDLRV